MPDPAKPPRRRRTYVPRRILEDGRIRCTNCKKAKHATDFSRDRTRKDGFRPWCKLCVRIDSAARRQTPEAQAKIAEYRRRPEVKEANNRRNLAARDRIAAWQERHNQTPRGKLMNLRRTARYQLRHARTEAIAARYRNRLAMLDREIARLEQPDRDLRSIMAAERHFGEAS